jgi:hypothetical protein
MSVFWCGVSARRSALAAFLLIVLIEIDALFPHDATGPQPSKASRHHVLTKPVGLSGKVMVTC